MQETPSVLNDVKARLRGISDRRLAEQMQVADG